MDQKNVTIRNTSLVHFNLVRGNSMGKVATSMNFFKE